MTPEVHGAGAARGAPDFYASPVGLVAARLVRERLGALWPDLRGRAVLGVGHAAPYLGLWREGAERCLALQHHAAAGGGAARWPVAGPRALAVGEDRLPFPDRAFDRVLLVHGLEAAENARVLLREVWRVLRDDGRVVVVAPNRRGLWAQLERTPFGHGQPYSSGQLARLLERQMFRMSRRDAALFVPPFRSRLLLRTAAAWEGAGRALWPGRYAGVVILEAEKDLWAAAPAGAVAFRRRVIHLAAAKAA